MHARAAGNAGSGPAGQPANAQTAGAAQAGIAWPRVIDDAARSITIYQPQIERWQDDMLEARAAVAVDKPGTDAQTLGVVWLKAHTAIDRENDLVTLDNIEVVKASFPSDPANADAYAAALRQHAGGGLRTISLSRLQASLQVAEAETATKALPVRNDPPKIIFSETPAMLVLVDGKPQLRQVTGSKLLRVINTPALMLFDEGSATYYLRALRKWWSAKAPDGSWAVAASPPATLAAALKAADPRQPDGRGPARDRGCHCGGSLPKLDVSLEPAELIQATGQPEYAPIPDTQLLYVKNTASQIIVDVGNQDHYVLISGRWFRSLACPHQVARF